MRIAGLLAASLYLVSCQSTFPVGESPKPAGGKSAASPRIEFEPVSLCSALDDVGLTGARWKEGAAGFGCSTQELQIGPRDISTAMSSTVWYEVRGDNEKSATTIVLGGDVRVPESQMTVKMKLIEAVTRLLQKLKLPMDEELRAAVMADRAVDRRLGNYIVRYGSQMAGKVRENRLTIQRAL
jgi:Family of unknown function (DUF6030)